ncbi:MAG: hypothetical protein NVS2B12_42200 [Ktedonobacteraceae bacterium]
MLTTHFMKPRTLYFILLIGMLLLLLAACGGGSSSSVANSATPTSSTVTAANAIIRHSPSGTIELTWDHTSHVLTVRLAMTGLLPRSIHPALISSGSCENPGKPLYTLSNVTADTIGFATAITRVKDVASSIPATGWYADIRNGPGMDTDARKMAISCANIVNSTASSSSTATLNLSPAPNQSASGLAELTVNGNRLAVTLTMKGMAPGSKHAAHIHLGSCVSQGKIIYPLNAVTVNAAGDGISNTTIDNVTAIPRAGWYVNIHLGSHVVESTTSQTDLDPVACGDLTPRI